MTCAATARFITPGFKIFFLSSIFPTLICSYLMTLAVIHMAHSDRSRNADIDSGKKSASFLALYIYNRLPTPRRLIGKSDFYVDHMESISEMEVTIRLSWISACDIHT